MAIKIQDPILKAKRKHLIPRIKELKDYKEDFDFNNIEWILLGSINNRPIEI